MCVFVIGRERERGEDGSAGARRVLTDERPLPEILLYIITNANHFLCQENSVWDILQLGGWPRAISCLVYGCLTNREAEGEREGSSMCSKWGGGEVVYIIHNFPKTRQDGLQNVDF